MKSGPAKGSPVVVDRMSTAPDWSAPFTVMDLPFMARKIVGSLARVDEAWVTAGLMSALPRVTAASTLVMSCICFPPRVLLSTRLWIPNAFAEVGHLNHAEHDVRLLVALRPGYEKRHHLLRFD